MLEAEVLLSDGQNTAAENKLSPEPPNRGKFAAIAARRTWLLGDLQFARGRTQAAEDLLAKARDTACSAGAWDVELEVDSSLARLAFIFRHDAAKADAIFRDIARHAAERRDGYYEAVALNGLGMIRLKQSHFDEAIPWFQRTVQAAGRGGAQRLIAAAGQNLAICYSQLGSFEQALKARQQAIDLLGDHGPIPYRMDLLGEMGSTWLLQGEAPKAVEFYQRALSLAATPADKARWHRTLAAAYADMHEWDRAEKSNRQALSYANDAESRPWAEKNAAAIAAGRGNYQEACALYRKAIEDAPPNSFALWESHAALGQLYANIENYAAANREFEETIRIIDINVDKVSTQNQLAFFARWVRFYQDYVASLIAQHAYERALAVADSSRARILMQRLGIKRAPEVAAARDYRDVARRSRSVLLFYWIAPEHSYLWVITPTRIYPPFELPAAEQIRRWVTQYRAVVEQPLGDPMKVESEPGRHLYEALIAPAVRLIPLNSRVIVIPDDALNWIDLATLPVYGGQSAHYWLEDVRPVVAPSLSVLAADKPFKPRVPDSLLIIGDPISPNPDFPPLPYASKEIEVITSRVSAAEKQAYTGSMARPAVFQAAHPERFSLLHFSAHALANKESPLESAIILSADQENYKLYARNIIETPLHADLVTISACRSAGAQSYSGEGLVGFAWAFLQAGARNVIAGLWDVTDSSTPEIMEVLYSRIAAGNAPEDALREAKLKLIHSGQGFRRPYYWGPFQVYTR